MKKWINSFTTMMLVMAMLALLCISPAMAATSNPSPASSGYIVMPLTFSRAITATATPIKFRLPYPCTLISMTACAVTLDFTDTTETYTVDLQEGGTTVLSSAVSLAAAGTIYSATISDAALADEATMTLVLTLGGTTPSLTDLTVLLVLRRL